ncbi:hypothetical protein ACFXHA_06095 [Nocardia sp. NPDC059240]|uniref:LppU/SCO3897 family protein n=1 Tax=Nocardia sp. NPDC059240 TaxID=3346786 RepID=UPI003692F625
MGVLTGAPLHSTVVAALREAGERVSPHPVDTRDLLVALIRADEPSRWSRILLHTGDADALAVEPVLDPASGTSSDWSGIPVTDSCAVALDIAGRLAQRYSKWPMPVGILVLGLIADESTAAAQVLAAGLDRAQLLRHIQDEVLGSSLDGLDTMLRSLVVTVNPRAVVADQSAANGIYCRHCGSTPAANVSFRRHVGVLMFMRFVSHPGPYCRDCGLAAYRAATVRSLWQGWWSPWSLFLNGIIMLTNLPERRRVLALSPPIPGAPGTPLNPGKPLYRRPAIVFLLVPIVAIGAISYAIVQGDKTDPKSAGVSDCFNQVPTYGSTTGNSLKKVSCSDPSARSKVVSRIPHGADGIALCAQSRADGYYEAPDAVLCVVNLK